MATKKVTKKPSKKLQASKKKSLNKWIILSGIVAVAVIGVAAIRFSGAAKWYVVKRQPVGWTVTTQAWQTATQTYFRPVPGQTYRQCFRGSSPGISRVKLRSDYAPGASLYSEVVVKGGSKVYCGKTFKIKTDKYLVSGLYMIKTAGPNVSVTAASYEVLR